MNASSRRLQKELADLQSAHMKTFKILDADTLLSWTGIILPESEPYNKGAYRVRFDFPAEYPFKPPTVTILTKIYHPNVDETGKVCLPIVSVEQWKPATKTQQVVAALLKLINEPEPDHPLRAELAEEFTKDKRKFMKNAEEFAKKHAEPRTV